MGISVKGDKSLMVASLPVVIVKKDLGATFANVATELAKYVPDSGIAIASVENTNGTGAGVRFYIYANGAWKYATLS